MIPEIIHLLFLIVILYVGASIAFGLGIRKLYELLGLAFPLGSLFVTLTIFILHHYFHLTLDAFLFSVVTLLAFPIGCVLFLRADYSSLTTVVSEATTLFKQGKETIPLSCVLILLVVFSFTHNLFWPISDWDAIAHYDFRARVIAETAQIDAGKNLGYFYQYPPYTSLLHVFSYILGSEHAKIWYTAVYASLLLLFYTHTYYLKVKIRMIFTTVLAVSPLIFQHSMIAYTNLAYTLFYVSSFFYALEFLRTRDHKLLYLTSFLVFGSVWTRMSEPFWIIPIGILIVGSTIDMLKARKIQTALVSHLCISIGLFIFAKGIWPSYLTYIQPVVTATASESSITSKTFIESVPYLKLLLSIESEVFFDRLIEVVSHLNKYMLSVLYPLLPGMILSIFLSFKYKRWHDVFTWVLILLHPLMILVGTFIFSFTFDTWNQIGGSLERMSMFLIPLSIFGISLIFKQKYKVNTYKKQSRK